MPQLKSSRIKDSLIAQFKRLSDWLENYCQINPYNPLFGLSRSLVAISTLITLVFSSRQILFDELLFRKLSMETPLDKINIYFLLGYNNIGLGIGISILVLLLVIIGYFPQITNFLHWYVTFSFQHAASITDGGDQIASILSLFFIPICLFDTRANHWSIKPCSNLVKNFIGRMALTLISLQMSIIYFHAAIEKMYKVEEWRNGTALYYFMNDELFGYADLFSPIISPLLLNATTVSMLTLGVV